MGQGVAVASDHVVMVFLIQPLVILLLAIGDWLMDDYLLAPVPAALRCMWPSCTASLARQSTNSSSVSQSLSSVAPAEQTQSGDFNDEEEEDDSSGDGEEDELRTTFREAKKKEYLSISALQGWIDIVSESISRMSSGWRAGSNRISKSGEKGVDLSLNKSHPNRAKRAPLSAAKRLSILSVKHAATSGQHSLKRRLSSKSSTYNSQSSIMEERGATREASLIRELARHVQHGVYLRRQELRDVMASGSWNDQAGRRSLHILEVMEADLFDSWGWVASKLTWEAEIAKIVKGHLRAAVELYEELKSDEYSYNYRMMKVIERERFDRLTPVERKVYAKTEDRALYQIKVREDAPPVWAYLSAWFVVFLFLAGVCAFTAQVATLITVDRAKLVLVAFCVVVAFYFGLVLPIEIVFFDVCLPALLREHLEYLKHPSELRRFRYWTPLPDSAACYLALMDPWLAKTTLGQALMRGEHIGVDPNTSSLWSLLSARSINNPELEEDPHFVLGNLSAIYRDSVFRPPPGTRFGLFLTSIILAAPTEYQEVVVEELTAGVVVLSAVISTHAELPQGFNLARRKPNSTSEVINYFAVAILSIVLGLFITLIIKLLNTRRAMVVIDGKHHERIAPSTQLDRVSSSSKSSEKAICVKAADVEKRVTEEEPEIEHDCNRDEDERQFSETESKNENDYDESFDIEAKYLASVLDDSEGPSSEYNGNVRVDFNAGEGDDFSFSDDEATLVIEFDDESVGFSAQPTHLVTSGLRRSLASTAQTRLSMPGSQGSSASTAVVYPDESDQASV